jgi:hypothetical protein
LAVVASFPTTAATLRAFEAPQHQILHDGEALLVFGERFSRQNSPDY